MSQPRNVDLSSFFKKIAQHAYARFPGKSKRASLHAKKLLTSLPYNIKMKHAREKMFCYVFFYHGITILWYFLYD